MYAAKQPGLKSNEAYGVHGKTRDTPTDYYDIVLDESKVEYAKEPLYDNVTEPSQQPIDVTYEEVHVPGSIHYNDPCQPIRLENNEAYAVHKSETTEMLRETRSQQVDLKSNEAYGVRGEVQVAAINGTTDAVCYSVINSPGQQSGETTSGAMRNVEAYYGNC